MATKIADGLATTGPGAAFAVPRAPGKIVLVVEITGTANVDLQGQVSPEAPWVEITDAPITATGAEVINKSLHTVRLNVNTIASGVVNAWLEL